MKLWCAVLLTASCYQSDHNRGLQAIATSSELSFEGRTERRGAVQDEHSTLDLGPRDMNQAQGDGLLGPNFPDAVNYEVEFIPGTDQGDQRHLIESGAYEYTYNQVCTEKTISTGDQCQSGYAVSVAGVPGRGSTREKVVFEAERTSQTWFCGHHQEEFTISQSWNTVMWWRVCNSCSSIKWRVYSCGHVGKFSTPSIYRVKIKTGSNCLSLPTGSDAKEQGYPYGIEEKLRPYPCSGNDKRQDFYLYITNSQDSKKYKLRPVQAVKGPGIDVCVVAPSMEIFECSKQGDSGGTLEHTGTEGSFATTYSIELKGLPANPPASGSDKEVYLVNYSSGGLKALTLKPHSIFGHHVGEDTHGDLLFESLVKDSASQIFILSRVPGGDGEFTLRPKPTVTRNIDVCVLDENPLELTGCKDGAGSLKLNVKWYVTDKGQIVSKAADTCITHSTTNSKGVAQACDDNSKSYVSALPVFNAESVSKQDFNQIPEVFPASGIQLSGNSDFNKVRVRSNVNNEETLLTESFAMMLKFSLESTAGDYHRVCLILDKPQGPEENWCIYLTGDAVPTDGVHADTTDNTKASGQGTFSYELHPKDLFENKGFDKVKGISKVQYIEFSQSGGDEATSSRFYNFETYDMITATTVSRQRDRITVALAFREGIDKTGLNFLPLVYMQSADGNYRLSVPAAETRREISDGNQITIDKLEPGRRYYIRLQPVNGSGQPFPSNSHKRSLKTYFFEHTTCSCKIALEDGKPEENTGSPTNLSIAQSRGRIMFMFTDNSVCEDAYAFTRTVDSDKISFIPNYSFYSTAKCSDTSQPETIEPPVEYSDDVRDLTVGNTYEYCVKAVAKTYMVKEVPTSRMDGTFESASIPECKDYTVQWESSVTIKVALKREAGSLPVEGVNLTWTLKDPSNNDAVIPIPERDQNGALTATFVNSDSATTPVSGKVTIAMMIPGLDENKVYDLYVTATKTTESVNGGVTTAKEHEFLCDNEEQLCSQTRPVAYLQHMKFGNEVVISDKTSVPFSGTVTIEKPQDVDTTLNPDFDDMQPLYLTGATVCLGLRSEKVGSKSSGSNCVTTNRQGEYILPATLGVTVFPEVTYHSHSFRYERNGDVPSTQITEGIYITEGGFQRGEYQGHDFVDTTTEELTVEVAGGVCNINLGTAKVVIRSEANLDFMWKVQQEGYQMNYTVPAHSYFLGVEDLRDMDEIPMQHHLDFLIDTVGQQYVDLKDYGPPPPAPEQPRTPDPPTPDDATEPPTASPILKPLAIASPGTAKAQADTKSQAAGSASLEQEEAAENSGKTARFQYEGKPLVFPSFSGDQLGDTCRLGNPETKTQKVPNKTDEYMSTHVIPTGNIMELIIVVREEIIRDEASPINSVYCDILDDGDFVEIRNDVGLKMPDDAAVLQTLKKNGADVSNYMRCTDGCRENLVQPTDPLEKSSVEIILQAGLPMKEAPYRKTIDISVKGTNHKMFVVVTGDRTSDNRFFSLPTHFPLLVIRDPPGGASYASYEQMSHTATVRFDQYEKYQGIEMGVGFRAGAGIESEACIVTPFTPGVCTTIGEIDVKASVSVEGETSLLTDYRDDEFSHSFTTTWSYTTSAESLDAGKESDMFLVPVMNILFVETVTISWDQATCIPLRSVKTKINLKAPENRRAFDLFSYDHVKTVEYPRLDAIILEKKAAVIASNGTNDSVIQKELEIAKASKASWTKFLADYNATNLKAAANDLDNVGEWFKWYSSSGSRKRPFCEVHTDEWNCTRPNGLKDKRKVTTHRCDHYDPAVPPIFTLFDSKMSSYYGNEDNSKFYKDEATKTDVFCATSSWQPVVGSRSITNWTAISEEHDYWKYWDFYHPLPRAEPHVGLAPNEVLLKAKVNPLAEDFASKITQSRLDSAGRIQFAGGGGEFEFALTGDEASSMMKKFSDDGPLAAFGNPLAKFDNSQQEFQIGAETSLELEAGFAGVEVDGTAFFNVEVDHKMLESKDSENEMSIGFLLRDDDMGDEFIVDVFLDPKYGTFVFNTIGGRSKCPYEGKPTIPIEDPYLEIIAPTEKIGPDEDMIFDVYLENNGYGDSWFTLYADSDDLEFGVTVDIIGEGYEADFNLKSTMLDPTAAVKAQVTVSRGPRLFEYKPVRLHLQSTCEKENLRYARQTSGIYDGDFQATLMTQELYNVGIESDNSARIKFLEPCPAVAVVGEMSRQGYFHVNQNTNKISISDKREYLDVGIYNPIFSSRGELKDQSRVQKVLLEYRKVGIVPWGSAMDKDNQVIDMKEVEDPYGYSNVRWPVPSQDAEYEIRVRVDCNSDDDPSGLPDDLKEFATTIIPGVVDRLKPKVFGHPEPQVNLLPGESLVVHFSEDIWCVEPYIFSVNIIVEELDNRVFEMGTSGGLDVICSGNTLEIQFAEDLSNSTGKLDNTDRAYFDKLLGRNFNLTISGVSDLRRNVMEPYEFYSRFMCLPPVPHLSMTHPDADRPYLPDEEILFNVTLANNGRDGNAFLELAVLQQSNPDNLEVFVHGQSLAIAHQYVFEAGESLPVTVSVKKGPGDKLHFKPIQLYLRSTCEEDNHEQATAFVSLYNHDEDGVKSIVFQHPCPEVRFAGAMHREPYFIMNKNLLQSTKELFGVSIFNVDYKNRRLHERSVDLQGSEPSNRLTEVVLNYRRKGSIGWSKGKTVVSDSNRTELDFSRDGVENSYGYATLQWDVSEITLDSEFEVKVVSSCTPLQGSHSELNEFSSEISSGVIDRNPPKLFGVPTLSLENSHYPSPNHPTKDFVLRFDEAIYCEEPFTFALVVTVTDDAGASVDFLDNEGLVVKCFGNDITYRFDLTSDSDFDRLSNSKVSISLSGVEDLARNVMDDPFTTSYDQCDQSLSHAKVYRGMGCDRFDNDCDLLIDECDEDIVAPTIEFPGHLIDSSSTNGEGELTHLLRDVCFDTVTRANAFLYANIAVEDDCAKDVRLDVVYIQDVSRPGRATFRATATDERCEGIGGDHIHSELFQVEIFENYTTLGLYDDDTIVMGMACDGRDQNCNGIIDDCDEDRIPPTITFKDALTVSAFERKSDGVTFIDSPTFQTLDSGEAYLYSIIKAEDDCATDMTVVVEPISQVQCDKTLFKVTISDPRCPDNNIQTVERIFALKIDDVDPVVSIGFELVPHSTYYDDEGQYLHIEETNYDFDPVFFHYNVDENCQQANVQVEVTVLSNEIEYAKTDGNSMVIMQKRNDDRQSHGIQIFVEPRMCARSETELKPLCEYDIGSAAVRYYKVHVKAIDYSGNVGVSEATVIVLHERWKTTFKDFKDTYQQSDFFINHVDSSPPPHRVLARMETVWDSTLSSAFEPTLMRQSSTSVLPVWNIELESSMTMSGLVLSDNSEERQTQFAVLTSTIKQTVESSLSDGDTISDVTITSAETLPLQSRRRMGQMQLQYVITITSQCVEECNETEDDVGASLASTVGELMEEEIGNGNFMAALSANVLLLADESPGNDILTSSRQQLSSDALNGLLSLSVTSVDADINFSVSSQLDAATSFSVPGMVWFANSDASSLTDIEMVTFLDDLKNMLSNLACSGIAVDICIVVIASINGNATSSPQRRHLESTVLAFEYVVHLEASCSDLDCSDVDSSAISDEIETAIADAVSTGSLANNLRSSSVVASSIIASVTAGPTNSPTQAPEGWYPDLVTRTGTCFDDGNLPSFMRSNETEWLESEKEDCCRIHFPEYFEYHICMGDVTGWFPYWQDDVHTCINDASKVPAYMKQNSELWLLPDLETCCTRHYSWAMEQCLLLGGGMDSISATNLWYVNWKEEVCVQDCLAQTGETAGDLICGGLAQNEELFETVEDCCSTKLHWITEGVCVVKSTSVESPQGSEKWYVQYTDQKCVQDCPKDQVDPTCGGVVDDARVPLYDNPALCCHESLNWIYIYDCLTVSGAVIR